MSAILRTFERAFREQSLLRGSRAARIEAAAGIAVTLGFLILLTFVAAIGEAP